MAQSPRKRKRDNPEVRREQILDEAIRIIGKRGYHGFTIQNLAQRCGLSNAGLLYHFPSKDHLLVSLVQEMEQREIQVVAPLVARVEAEDTRGGASMEAILDLMHTMVERGSSKPELARLYAILQSESLDADHPAYESFRERESAVLNLFTRLVAPYTAEPLSTARLLLALLDGLRLQWLRADQGFDAVAEWLRAVAALLPGLTIPSASKQRPRLSAKTAAIRQRQALTPTRKQSKPTKQPTKQKMKHR